MIFVFDNFFSDPWEVRRIALKQEYHTEDFNYPGIRTHQVPLWVNNYIKSSLEYHIKETLIPVESSFQIVSKDFNQGIYHRDGDGRDIGHHYICIIYLSLDPPPYSGVKISDKTIGKYGQNDDEEGEGYCSLRDFNLSKSFYRNPKSFLNAYRYGRLVKSLNSYFDESSSEIQNFFNRCIMFEASRYHSAQKYFGTSKENSRLSCVSFLNK